MTEPIDDYEIVKSSPTPEVDDSINEIPPYSPPESDCTFSPEPIQSAQIKNCNLFQSIYC